MVGNEEEKVEDCSLHFPKEVVDAQVIINLPVMKTHDCIKAITLDRKSACPSCRYVINQYLKRKSAEYLKGYMVHIGMENKNAGNLKEFYVGDCACVSASEKDLQVYGCPPTVARIQKCIKNLEKGEKINEND